MNVIFYILFLERVSTHFTWTRDTNIQETPTTFTGLPTFRSESTDEFRSAFPHFHVYKLSSPTHFHAIVLSATVREDWPEYPTWNRSEDEEN